MQNKRYPRPLCFRCIRPTYFPNNLQVISCKKTAMNCGNEIDETALNTDTPLALRSSPTIFACICCPAFLPATKPKIRVESSLQTELHLPRFSALLWRRLFTVGATFPPELSVLRRVGRTDEIISRIRGNRGNA